MEGGGAWRKKNLEFGPQECSGENEQGRLFGQGETQWRHMGDISE